MVVLSWAATATAATSPTTDATNPGFGPNVLVFDPSMPVSEIQATVDAIHARQVDNEMGTDRYALLFKPGEYGTDANPLQMKVGYYTRLRASARRRRTSSSTARSRSTTAASRTAAPATASRWSTSGARCPT
jgi:hypothetical protein